MPKKRATQHNPLVKVTYPPLDPTLYRESIDRIEARWPDLAARLGVDVALTGRERWQAVRKATSKRRTLTIREPGQDDEERSSTEGASAWT